MPPISTPGTSDKINTKVIETFVARIRQAHATGSKEIKVPMPEGYELALALGQVMARNQTLFEEMRAMEKLVSAEFQFDGGDLSSK